MLFFSSYIIDCCIIDKIEIIFQQIPQIEDTVSPFIEKCFDLLEAITAFPQSLNPSESIAFSSLIASVFKESYFGTKHKTFFSCRDSPFVIFSYCFIIGLYASARWAKKRMQNQS